MRNYMLTKSYYVHEELYAHVYYAHEELYALYAHEGDICFCSGGSLVCTPILYAPHSERYCICTRVDVLAWRLHKQLYCPATLSVLVRASKLVDTLMIESGVANRFPITTDSSYR